MTDRTFAERLCKLMLSTYSCQLTRARISTASEPTSPRCSPFLIFPALRRTLSSHHFEHARCTSLISRSLAAFRLSAHLPFACSPSHGDMNALSDSPASVWPPPSHHAHRWFLPSSAYAPLSPFVDLRALETLGMPKFDVTFDRNLTRCSVFPTRRRPILPT